jgi:hypothetical protein
MTTATANPAEIVGAAAIDAMDDLLNSMADAAPDGPKAKQKLTASEPALEPHIDQYLNAKAKEAEWASVAATAAEQIKSAGKRLRIDACRRAGAVHASCAINGRVQIMQKCQYTEIKAPHLPAIREVFSAEEMLRYFPSTMKLELVGDANANEALLKQIIAAIGPGAFKAAFKVSRKVTVSEAFHRAVTLDPEVEAKARPLMDMHVIKAYEPTIGLTKGAGEKGDD